MRNIGTISAIAVSAVIVAATAPAKGGELEAEASIDFLGGDSTSATLFDGEPKERLSAEEVGMRIRADLRELDDRLAITVDYLGREPISGEFPNAAHRLLYRAELSYELLEDRLTLGIGRFIPASAVFLPVDGARVDVHLTEELVLRAFGGRRGVTTSRKNVELERVLPAFGGGGTFIVPWGNFELAVAFAKDDVFPLEDELPSKEYSALNLVFSGVIYPVQEIRIGTRETFVQQATVVLGPSWREFGVEVKAINLFGAVLFADWEPIEKLRVALDLQHQRAAVYRNIDPRFTDATLALAYAPIDRLWLKPNARVRKRTDRLELRYGIDVEANHLGIRGLGLRAFVFFQDVSFDSDAPVKPELDRILWSAAVAWEGFDLQIEAGARFIEGSGGPFSNRGDQDATIAADLSPFVLEAQRVAFLRAFYADEQFFAGADLERSVEDRELRFFLQMGTLLEESW